MIRKSYAALRNLVTSLPNPNPDPDPNPDPNPNISGQVESESEKTARIRITAPYNINYVSSFLEMLLFIEDNNTVITILVFAAHLYDINNDYTLLLYGISMLFPAPSAGEWGGGGAGLVVPGNDPILV